jgi:hypothetical protein
MSNEKLITGILKASDIINSSRYSSGSYLVTSAEYFRLIEIEKIRNKRIQTIKDILK